MRTGQDGVLIPRRQAPRGELVIEVPSFTTPGITYVVRQHADGSWSCDCPDCVCRQHECKHIAAVKARKRGELL